MRTVGLAFLIVLVLVPQTLLAQNTSDYFPVEVGRIWSYTNGLKIGVAEVWPSPDGAPWAFFFEGYSFTPRIFSKVEDKVVEITEDGMRRLWYDFGAEEGESWVIKPFENRPEGDIISGSRVTLVSRSDTVSVPYGHFKECVHLVFIPNSDLADAGVLEEWFAPGIGLVKRVEQTIAGPRAYELEDWIPGEPLVMLNLEIRTDKEVYSVEEPVEITIIAHNYGHADATLNFGSSLEADYTIDNAYRWSEGKSFLEVIGEVTIPAGEKHEWSFTHNPEDYKLFPGRHIIAGEVVGNSLRASTTIAVEGESGTGVIEGYVSQDTAPGEILIPLEGAMVVAVPAFYFRDDVVVSGDGVVYPEFPPMPPYEYSAVTGPDGYYRIEGLYVGGEYRVMAYMGGYENLSKVVKIEENTIAKVDFALTKTPVGTIEGFVSEDTAPLEIWAPLEGVEVVAMPGFYFGDDVPPPMGADADMPIREYSAVTGPDGYYRIEGLYVGGEYKVMAYMRGYESISKVVRIEEDGVVEKVNFALKKIEEDIWRNSNFSFEDSVKYEIATDRDFYRLHETMLVRYRATNYGSEPVTFEFQTGQNIELMILLPDSLDSSPIWLWSDRMDFTPSPTYVELETGDSFEFTLELNLAEIEPPFPGTLLLEGFMPCVNHDPDKTRIYVKFQVGGEPAFGIVEGYVSEGIGPAGQWIPISRAEVIIYPESEVSSVRYQGITHDDGYFSIEGVMEGWYRVTAHKEGYESSARSVKVSGGSVARVDLTLKKLEGEAWRNSNFSFEDSVKYEIATDKEFYGPDEMMLMRYRATNYRGEPITFEFRTVQKIELLILSPDHGDSIWRWSDYEDSTDTFSYVKLESGDSFEFIWELNLSQIHHPISGKELTLVGFMPCVNHDPDRTKVAVNFKVDGEPGPGVVEGYVSEDTGFLDVWIPIEGAEVVMHSTVDFGPAIEYRAITNREGYFRMEGLPIGMDFEVTARGAGYRPAVRFVKIREPFTRVSFQLKKADFEGWNNISRFHHNGMEYELSTGRHFYAPGDLVKIRYGVRNIERDRVVMEFPSGQQIEFILLSESGEVWRWSDGLGFSDAITYIELKRGDSAEFEAQIDLGSLGMEQMELLLVGYLPCSNYDHQDIRSEETKVALGLAVGYYHIVDVFIDTESEEKSFDLKDEVSLRINLGGDGWDSPPEVLSFSELPQNLYSPIPGYEVLKVITVQSELSYSVNANVSVYYEDYELESNGISDESNVELFYWDNRLDPPQWVNTYGSLDPGSNSVSAEVPLPAPLGLFARIATSVDDIDDVRALPEHFGLKGNFPNPFNPSTSIVISVPSGMEGSEVDLSIYDLLGRRVKELFSGTLVPGEHSLRWDGKDDSGRRVSSGIYVCVAMVDGKISGQALKMVLAK